MTQAEANPLRPFPWDPAEFLPRHVCHQARVTAETQGGALGGRPVCRQLQASRRPAPGAGWSWQGWDPGKALEVTSKGISSSAAGGLTWDCEFTKH